MLQDKMMKDVLYKLIPDICSTYCDQEVADVNERLME